MSDDLKNFNHVDLLFPSKYAKAADLRGATVVVTIERIDPREKLMMAGGKSDTKPVIYLKGKSKGWILNKTNARSIAKVYGNEVTQWLGKPVAIYSTPVEARGEMVDAIRVNVEATRKSATGVGHQSVAPDTDDAARDEAMDSMPEPGSNG